jgi:hypothetical protein
MKEENFGQQYVKKHGDLPPVIIDAAIIFLVFYLLKLL